MNYYKIIKILIFTLCLNITTAVYSTDSSPKLSSIEQEITTTIKQNKNEAIRLLEKIVNINSGSENTKGVYNVGKIVQKEFEKLGFTSEWKNPPAEMSRAGTLMLTRKGTQGKKLLLIAHLDTVFAKDSPFQHFSHENDLAIGPGIADDKGGIVLMLYALKALHAHGALDNTTISIALVGDEENSGKPIRTSRAPLFLAAKGIDVALDFEPTTSLETATIARRGSSRWEIISTGKSAHSYTIFQKETGHGAILELARVLDQAQSQLAGQQNITFNPGIIVGGTNADINKVSKNATGYGKNNVVAQIAYAQGDARYLTIQQREFIKKTVTDITKKSLPGTTSSVSFEDTLPPMTPTAENLDLLNMYSKASNDLGYPTVIPISPDLSGGADISHIAALVPANLSRLGPVGSDFHTVNESMNIPSLEINTQRAAILIYRLTR